VYASLFTGSDLEHVSITGHGILDGQGEAWWNAHRLSNEFRRKAGISGVREAPNPPEAPLKWGRPRMINLYRCKNVQITGLRILNSPSWNIHPVLCENVCIDGVTIHAPARSPNTDGIDPDSCKNVRIANSTISVGDDCVIIKSGYAYQENGTPCENITVTNCVFGSGHAGVGIGSETSGGVKNVTISNCICDGTDRGLRFKTARGRGNVVENIRASNFVMRNVGEAVTVTMFYTGGDMHTPQPVSKKTPIFRNFHFSEIVVTGVKRPVVIEGLPEMPIQGISINNLVADSAEIGAACTNAVGLVLDTMTINAQKGPALTADSVSEMEIYRVTTRKPLAGTPVVRLQNVNNAVVQSCTAAQGTDTFLEVSGSANKDISLFANRLSRAAREVAFVEGAAESTILKG
jgi:polygalacturonase